MKQPILEIKDLNAGVEGKQILKGINLTISVGEVHAIMGPNGSGKSTLAAILAGRDGYDVTSGQVLYNGQDLLDRKPGKRRRGGWRCSTAVTTRAAVTFRPRPWRRC